ncbi:hypothetical protein R1flu_027329 [Riccia fluitans]|uniref:Uncharacterized protein n=1 Tax=Riccia fluitans TaxID=41844 RepID=A0ABD1XLH9_9MARC
MDFVTSILVHRGEVGFVPRQGSSRSSDNHVPAGWGLPGSSLQSQMLVGARQEHENGLERDSRMFPNLPRAKCLQNSPSRSEVGAERTAEAEALGVQTTNVVESRSGVRRIDSGGPDCRAWRTLLVLQFPVHGLRSWVFQNAAQRSTVWGRRAAQDYSIGNCRWGIGHSTLQIAVAVNEEEGKKTNWDGIADSVGAGTGRGSNGEICMAMELSWRTQSNLKRSLFLNSKNWRTIAGRGETPAWTTNSGVLEATEDLKIGKTESGRLGVTANLARRNSHKRDAMEDSRVRDCLGCRVLSRERTRHLPLLYCSEATERSIGDRRQSVQ